MPETHYFVVGKVKDSWFLSQSEVDFWTVIPYSSDELSGPMLYQAFQAFSQTNIDDASDWRYHAFYANRLRDAESVQYMVSAFQTNFSDIPPRVWASKYQKFSLEMFADIIDRITTPDDDDDD